MGKPIPYTVQAELLHQISTITAHSDPSVSFADSSPYAGAPREVRSKICIAPTVSGSFPVSVAISIPGKRNKCIGTALIRY